MPRVIITLSSLRLESMISRATCSHNWSPDISQHSSTLNNVVVVYQYQTSTNTLQHWTIMLLFLFTNTRHLPALFNTKQCCCCCLPVPDISQHSSTLNNVVVVYQYQTSTNTLQHWTMLLFLFTNTRHLPALFNIKQCCCCLPIPDISQRSSTLNNNVVVVYQYQTSPSTLQH